MPPQLFVALSFAAYTFAAALVYWPGQIDPDTLDELHSAATGRYNDFHTPLLSALWRGPYLLGFRSPGWILLLGIATMLCGLYLVLRIRFGRVASTALAMAVCTWPPVLSWTIHVGRDTWFIAFLLVAFGAAARMMRMGRRQRTLNLIVCLVAAALCSASWQIALAPLFVLFVLLARQFVPSVRFRLLAVLSVGLVACFGLYGVQRGLEKAIHTKTVYPQQATFVYDLAQMSTMENKLLLPHEVLVPNRPTLHLLKQIVSVGTYDQIVYPSSHVVIFGVDAQQEAALQHAWIHAVTQHPFTYLDERARLALAELAITHPSFWTFQVPPDPPAFKPISTTLQGYGLDYLGLFAVGENLYGDPLYSVWAYLLVLIAAIPILFRRRGPADAVGGTFAVAMIVFTVTMAFTVPTLIYRFAYPIVVGGTVMLPLLIPRSGARGSQPAPDPVIADGPLEDAADGQRG